MGHSLLNIESQHTYNLTHALKTRTDNFTSHELFKNGSTNRKTPLNLLLFCFVFAENHGRLLWIKCAWSATTNVNA